MTHSEYPSGEVVVAEATLARARREIELLAVMAGAPRQATAVLTRLGLTLADLSQPDTRSIYRVLLAAGRADDGLLPWDRELIALACRWLLAGENLWDASDTRACGSSMRWGPERLARLLTACRYDADLLAAIASDLMTDRWAVA